MNTCGGHVAQPAHQMGEGMCEVLTPCRTQHGHESKVWVVQDPGRMARGCFLDDAINHWCHLHKSTRQSCCCCIKVLHRFLEGSES